MSQMDRDEMESVKHPVHLNYFELMATKSALNNKIRKREREAAKSKFIPDEGKIDVSKAGLEVLRSAHRNIDAAIGLLVFRLKP